MKKNLRIVSAAAAALLAVAPVAASAVSVNAADNTTVNATNSNQDYSHINLNGNVTSTNNVTNVNPSLVLSAANGNIPGNFTGSITATFNGTSATANLKTGKNGKADIQIADASKNVVYDGAKDVNKLSKVKAGVKYDVTINGVGFNFGANNAGKKVTLAMPKTSGFAFYTTNLPKVNGKKWTTVTDSNGVVAIKGNLDNNGTVNGLTIKGSITAFDAANTNGIQFYNIASGQLVTSGNVDVVANANGQLNAEAVRKAISSYYIAVQKNLTANDTTNGGRDDKAELNTVVNGKLTELTTASDIAAQLKKQNVPVDANGNFAAPHSFTVDYKVTSTVNGKSNTLPVTVTVANVAAPVVPSVSKTIMHNAYYYDKDAKRVGTDKLTRYNSVTVSPKTTTINGKAYYEVVENGKLSGKFINADNIDGTKRTLKHNAYVYKTSKKRANKVTLKKGTEVTTYGGTYTFKNGKQYYKIGNNTDKTYVKASNF